MDDSELTIDAVAIALTRIEAGPTVRFIGTDIGTGAAVTIVIETPGLKSSRRRPPIFAAEGLVLMLTIEPMVPTT